MDPTKLDGVCDWKTPTTVTEVQSFISFANFYRKFIDHFSDMAHPLIDLTKKNTKWTWGPAQKDAFQALKAKFLSAPVLVIPNGTKPFALETDAFKFATRAVLCQQNANGDWHPCGYLLRPAEWNYEIYDCELFGIIRSLKAWKHYLLGNPHLVTILSDYKNLTY